ncbi:MAG: T9SS type A sorting domain-containing protein [Saprospiraceae bacterium]
MKNLARLHCTGIFLLLLFPVLAQKNAPAAPVAIHITPATALPGDTICLEVRASDFTPVYLFQFALQWDTSMLHYVSASSAGCPDAPFLTFGTALAPEGRLIVLGGSAGPGFVDSSCLFRLCFSVDPAAWGTGFVQKYPAYPIEFLNTNGQNLAYAISPGIVTINTPLRLANAVVNPAGCRGPAGGIEVVPVGGQLPYVVQWSDTSGLVTLSPHLDQAPPGRYFLKITDQSGQTLRDTFDIKNSGTPLDIRSSTVKHATCDRPNGCIKLQPSGGAAPLQVRWADDPLALAERCDLAPGVYRVEVTDTAGCRVQAGFSVNKLPGFALDRVKDKPACDQPGFIELQPQGGVPPYRTRWSTGDTALILSGLEVGYYHVTVTDAQGCSVEKDIALHDAIFPVAYGWESTFDCPQIFDQGTLEMEFGNFSNPNLLPLTIDWYFGKTDTVRSNDPGNAEVVLRNIPPGLQHNVIRQADGCAFVGAVTVDCRPPSDFTGAEGAVLKIEQSTAGCSKVVCKDCADVTALQGSLAWPTSAMQPIGLNMLDSSGIYAWNFYPDTVAGRLSFFWHAPDDSGRDLTELFEVCFLPKDSAAWFSGLSFTKEPAGTLLRRADGREMPVTAVDGPVVFQYYFTEFELFGGKVIAPGCAADGKRTFGAQAYPFFLELYYYVFPLDSQAVAFEEINRAGRLIAGYYSILVAQPVYGSGGALLFLPPEVFDPCVWPGDADNNGTVNHYDLLSLGLGFGATGPARVEQGVDWSGAGTARWGQHDPARGVDYQNSDTDGNGIINAADTLAIRQNWGRVVDHLANSPYEGPAVSPERPDAPPLFIDADTLTAGQMAALPVAWGGMNNPAEQAYGLAFTLRYDTNLVGPDLLFVPESSWFGDTAGGELLCMQQHFRHWGLLSVAMTRLDGQNAQGEGAIGKFVFTAGTPPASRTGTFELVNALALGNNADPVPLHVPDTKLHVNNPQVSLQEVGSNSARLILQPNPAANNVWVETPGTKIRHIGLFNATGQCVSESAVGGVEKVRFPVLHLPEGLYAIRVRTDAGVGLQKLVIERN